MFFEVQWIGLGCCYDEIHVHVVISTVVILFIYSAVVTSLRGNKASRHIFFLHTFWCFAFAFGFTVILDACYIFIDFYCMMFIYIICKDTL